MGPLSLSELHHSILRIFMHLSHSTLVPFMHSFNYISSFLCPFHVTFQSDPLSPLVLFAQSSNPISSSSLVPFTYLQFSFGPFHLSPVLLWSLSPNIS
jgi:hypothetical protein